MLLVLAFAAGLALVSLGGGLYEVVVIDPSWPKRPELIQPARGGISRRRFWIPAHIAFEVMLIASLALAWSKPSVCTALLVALASHAVMRAWSGVDFIPKALRFERADPATVTETMARAWTWRSRLRLALDLVTCAAMLLALTNAASAG